jgi:hypothetical protein
MYFFYNLLIKLKLIDSRRWAHKVVPAALAMASSAIMCWSEYDFVYNDDVIQFKKAQFVRSARSP